MILRAGRILQGRPEFFGRMHPHLRAHAVVNSMLDLVSPFPSTRLTPGQIDERLHHRRGIFRRDQNIQVADGGTHPSQAAGRFRFDNSLHFFERRDDLLRQRDTPAPAGSAPSAGIAMQCPSRMRGLGFGAHARAGRAAFRLSRQLPVRQES